MLKQASIYLIKALILPAGEALGKNDLKTLPGLY
jgi:hypothetical protein